MGASMRVAVRTLVSLGFAAMLVPSAAAMRNVAPAEPTPIRTAPPVIQSERPPDAAEGWYTVAPAMTVKPGGPGRVLYRWDYGPGSWKQFPGAVTPPPGKHLLQVVRVSSAGKVSAISEAWTKVDAFATPVSMMPPDLGESSASKVGMSSKVNVTVRVVPAGGAVVKRIGGANRYAVAINASREAFASSTYIVVATGEKFPDALAASPLAGCLQAPILLTVSNKLPSGFSAEVSRLGAKKAVIVGGPSSVYPAVVTQLKRLGLQVERIGGANRYACAANIGARVLSYHGNGGKVFVARGDIYPDALALGPLAFATKTPIVLTLPASLPSYTQTFLRTYSFSDGYLAGGPGSITPAVATQIGKYVTNTTRIPGADRYECAVNIATVGVSKGFVSASSIGLATGEKFADALTGGVASGKLDGPILLTRQRALPRPTSSFITKNKFQIFVVDSYGGPASVSDFVLGQARLLLK